MRVILVANTGIARAIPGYTPHFDISEEWVEDADELAEMAGRLCYLSWDRPNPKTATNEGYIANIIAQQHFSVLEHASATFYIDGVSRNFTHELIRHRHLSFSEVSQRYVDVGEFQVVRPPALEVHGVAIEAENKIQEAEFASVVAYDHVHNWLEDKVSKKEARQAARYYLPGGLETKILVTGNMRAWREVISKRTSVKPDGTPNADLEFFQVAGKILQHLREIAPNTFQDFDDPA